MRRIQRIAGLTFIITGLGVAAALTIALISSVALDCPIDGVNVDCPRWLLPFAKIGTSWIVPGFFLALVGILIRPRG